MQLYWEKKYQVASMCFEKAGDTNWEKRAKAAGLRETADQLRISNPKEACTILREAAEIFDSIGLANSAAECFCDLGDYERAGTLFNYPIRRFCCNQDDYLNTCTSLFHFHPAHIKKTLI